MRLHLASQRLIAACGLLILLCCREPAAAQSTATTNGRPLDLERRDAHAWTDQQDQRRRSNAPYFDVPLTGRVVQRFEMYSPHSEQHLRELKSMGFTQVILDWPNLHAAATKAGLQVVLANWWINSTTPEEIERGLQRAEKVNSKSLIGFSVMDEPGRNSPDTPFDYYIDLYQQLLPNFRQQFPNTRLEISHWGPMASWDTQDYQSFSSLYAAADVMRIMPYPDLHEAPLDDVFLIVHRSRKLMQIAKRDLPLVVILQTWILPPDNKLPEISELRVMAYQALFSGAETISFFDYNTEVWKQTAGFEVGFRNLMSELTSFSRRHRDDVMTSTLGADGVLSVKLVSPAGVQTSVFVNTRRYAVKTLQPLEIRVTMDVLSLDALSPDVLSKDGPSQDSPAHRPSPNQTLGKPRTGCCVPKRCSPRTRQPLRKIFDRLLR